MSGFRCEFYVSTQRFTIFVKTERANEETTSDLFHREAEGRHMGSLGAWRVHVAVRAAVQGKTRADYFSFVDSVSSP